MIIRMALTHILKKERHYTNFDNRQLYPTLKYKKCDKNKITEVN